MRCSNLQTLSHSNSTHLNDANAQTKLICIAYPASSWLVPAVANYGFSLDVGSTNVPKKWRRDFMCLIVLIVAKWTRKIGLDQSKNDCYIHLDTCLQSLWRYRHRRLWYRRGLGWRSRLSFWWSPSRCRPWWSRSRPECGTRTRSPRLAWNL